MSEKVPLKEVLAAVDMNAKSLWDEIDDDQRKALKSEFFILNRYISNAKVNNRDTQEHFVLAVNEYFNKHWNLLQKHPKLLWQLLCMCGHESQKIFYHEWIGYKKKANGNNNKKIKYLSQIYPNMKMREIEMLADINTEADLRQHAEQSGMAPNEVAKLF